MMGGRIWIERSIVGLGSTFAFTIVAQYASTEEGLRTKRTIRDLYSNELALRRNKTSSCPKGWFIRSTSFKDAKRYCASAEGIRGSVIDGFTLAHYDHCNLQHSESKEREGMIQIILETGDAVANTSHLTADLRDPPKSQPIDRYNTKEQQPSGF